MNARAHPFVEGIVLATHSNRDRLFDAWRGNSRVINEHLRFINQHLRTIAERDERLTSGAPVHRPAYVRQCQDQLAIRLPAYAAAVRRFTECEMEMEAAGIDFPRDSYAWENA